MTSTIERGPLAVKCAIHLGTQGSRVFLFYFYLLYSTHLITHTKEEKKKSGGGGGGIVHEEFSSLFSIRLIHLFPKVVFLPLSGSASSAPFLMKLFFQGL